MKDMKKWSFLSSELNSDPSVKITYTAMHGVGTKMVERIFKEFKLAPFVPVLEQIFPDPDFPTVSFPNPEEGKGALKLAIETADREGCSVIVANDPDADRLAAAEKDASSGEWYVFSGNDLGILIADWVVTRYLSLYPEVDRSKLVVLNTTVSSKMLSSFAAKEGLYYEETLTGFKWIGTKAEQLRNQGYTVLMAFEEAIGYMVGGLPLDKDGILAAATFSEMSHFLYKSGSTLKQRLEELYSRYGYYITNNKYFFCYDYEVQKAIFKEIRNSGNYPTHCDVFKIKGIRDLTSPGYDNNKPDNKPTFPVSSSQMITFYFENGAVVTLRGSGTEPKLKYYIELCGSDPVETKKDLMLLSKAIINNFLQPHRFPLVAPDE
eukprot:TRINITY_DN730_c0_g2_i4.p1 TRINITY_DN730_c0_g2~~TRINITY_DN730_c0_g2_i4.p1  ORF type:complete len:378 (+),score=75.49 TRINITY_DN730_c0_g2_i4:742-1875(+)